MTLWSSGRTRTSTKSSRLVFVRSSADLLSVGGQAVRVASPRGQEALRADVPDVGYLPQGREEVPPVCLLFPAQTSKGVLVLLNKVDHKDPTALADQADELWALHAHDSVEAAVQEVSLDDACINVLKQQSKDKSGDNRKEEKSNRQGPSLTARLESGLCHGHWVYGESSTTCNMPCTWQGNGKRGDLNAISPGNLLHLHDQLYG